MCLWVQREHKVLLAKENLQELKLGYSFTGIVDGFITEFNQNSRKVPHSDHAAMYTSFNSQLKTYINLIKEP